MNNRVYFLYTLVLNLIYFGIMAWVGYQTITGKYPWYAIFLVFAMLTRWPYMLTGYRRNAAEDDHFTIDLHLDPPPDKRVTPAFIMQTLNSPSVRQVIHNDLLKTGQIGYREEWRLGLITPDQDTLENFSLTRTAVLHSNDYYENDNIAITRGAVMPMGLSKWSYGVTPKLNRGEYLPIRSIQVDHEVKPARHRSPVLTAFLQEDGFPLKDAYPDGDPLTADRGGTIVIDKERVIVIYPAYFTQRRLIDDEGNLVDLGIDEDLSHALSFRVKMQPAVSKLLFQRVSAQGYIPVVRYHSFPYVSDFMLPLLDTPTSASGWADLFVDPRGKGKLYIAKDKTVAEWYEMMSRLKQLFETELALKNNHLLSFTKDPASVQHYLSLKMDILRDYYIIQDWDIC